MDGIIDGTRQRVAWVEYDATTKATTLYVEGVVDPEGFARRLCELAVNYAVDRTREEVGIERTTLRRTVRVVRGSDG